MGFWRGMCAVLGVRQSQCCKAAWQFGRAGSAWLARLGTLPRGGNITELRAEIFSGPHRFDDRLQSILGAEN